ncbi:NarK/NasA family nitrate transporter [Inhella gelatinilytica]|uniref:NarK/NasA family nitrate transporter n=1 Tax=Inhella gelatinilytica TaxID=2795030 RepID=A0A931NDB5_9BURK|nr:NarK/NasA family nitrate transporter [Inhella gelatinilytica]MBH9552065.1 NarK/NasA family nitrate transporter [Inhella gelatinilytica]
MAKIQNWKPEDPTFWQEQGSALAWRTCAITTFSLIFSFATWFVMSAVVVRMPAIGFKFTTTELFWLAAMPGLASGILRLIHSNFIPVLGTRPVISISTIIKVIPMVWLGYAIQDLNTPYMTFLMIAFLCGMGGGDFSSFMPSTSIFFPKRLQGTAMGIQAGIGNFGVSVVQFVAPWIIGFAALGASVGGPQVFTKGDAIKGALTVTKAEGKVTDVGVKPEYAAAVEVVRGEDGQIKDVVFKETDTVKAIKADVEKDANGVITQVNTTKGVALEVKRNPDGAITDVSLKNVVKKGMWLQNAAFIWVPFLVLAFILSALFLKSLQLPTRGFMGQFEILSSRNRARTHTWNCTITYICSFGSFSGFSAAFPMLIKTLYGGFDGAPDPLAYAYLGPLIGGLVRMLTGGFFDKIGGSKGMQWTTLGQILGVVYLVMSGSLTPTSVAQFDGFLWGMLWIFLMSGINNAATFRQYPIVFAYSPAKGAQMLGWTGAWAAFGPFVWNALIGTSLDKTGTVTAFFVGAAVFYAYSLVVNWWYYTRKGAERFDYGNAGGTWWDALSEPEKDKMRRIDLKQA